MKKLKKIIIVLLVIVGLFVAIGFFLPKEINVERSKTIDAPVEMIYSQISNFNEWKNWSPWYKMDTAVEMTFQNLGMGKEASYSWKSEVKSVGSGSMTIVDCEPFEYINTELSFDEQGNATAGFKFVEEEGKVKVTWTMNSNVGSGPIMGWVAMAMKSMVGSSYEQGLADLDVYCQELKETNWHYVDIKPKAAIEFYGIYNEGVTMETMAPIMGQNFGALMEIVETEGLEPANYPFCAYYSWGESFEMSCGIELKNAPEEIEGLEYKTLPEATYASYIHIGSYDKLPEANMYLMEWLEKNNLEIAGPVLEIYQTDPMKETDPAKWVTEILYPVKMK